MFELSVFNPYQDGDTLQVIDSDASGSIDLDEFVSGCMRLHGPAKLSTERVACVVAFVVVPVAAAAWWWSSLSTSLLFLFCWDTYIFDHFCKLWQLVISF